MQKLDNFIDGKYVAPIKNQYIDNRAPASGEVYSMVADASIEDVALAVEAARKAQTMWANTPIIERSKILIKIAELIESNLELFAEMECRDTGKPIQSAKTVDIPRAAANFRFFGAAIANFATEAHIMENVAVNYTRRAPLGIVGCISPWNLPLYLFTWKIAPALAMGNCVIGKPSEMTPATAHYMGRIVSEAGLPNGALAILQGRGNVVGQAIVDHPAIKAISFTGGTQTGQKIAQSTASRFKKLSLELGGKNPIVVFNDCDHELAIKETVRAAFSNQGQICLCGSRILIEASFYEKFKSAFIAQVKSLQIGDPKENATQFGAVISAEHKQKILNYISLAKQEGGLILCGGNAINPEGLQGFFVEPTVIENLDSTSCVNQEEIFGPVVTLSSFKSVDEAISLANSTDYGLACSIWTTNISKAHQVAHRIQAGIVWINCWMLRDLRTPFGGMKDSGLGREGGDEALRFFSEPQNICVKL